MAFTVNAKAYWTDSGIDVKRGQKYVLSVVSMSDTIKDRQYAASGISGLDKPGAMHGLFSFVRAKRVNGEPWFALIGSIDREHYWRIVDGEEFCAAGSGRLYCFFNDARWRRLYRNNHGYVTLELR